VRDRWIEEADWAALAGLRSSENTVRGDFGRPSEERTAPDGTRTRVEKPFYKFLWHGAAAGTYVDEIRDWFRRMGVPDHRIRFAMKRAALVTNFFSAFDVNFDAYRRTINDAIDAGHYVALAVHPDVMYRRRELSRTRVGGHFVLLTSRIEPETGPDEGDAVAGFGFACLTWGRQRRVWFPADAADQALTGYVAVDLQGRHDAMPPAAPAAGAAPAAVPAAAAPVPAPAVAEVAEAEVVRAFAGPVIEPIDRRLSAGPHPAGTP
jgi:hypothetical protein